MAINQELEETFRKLVGHAIRNEQHDITRIITKAGPETTGRVISLCIRAGAYVCLYAAERWPGDADLKEVTRAASEAGTGLPVTESDMYNYLSRVVFGAETGAGNFSNPLVPLFTLANLLVAFDPPHGKGWNDWLDVIESAIEAADQVRATDLPAMVFRFARK